MSASGDEKSELQERIDIQMGVTLAIMQLIGDMDVGSRVSVALSVAANTLSQIEDAEGRAQACEAFIDIAMKISQSAINEIESTKH